MTTYYTADADPGHPDTFSIHKRDTTGRPIEVLYIDLDQLAATTLAALLNQYASHEPSRLGCPELSIPNAA